MHTVGPLIGIASKDGPQEPVRKGRTDLPFPIDATALLFGVMTFSLIFLMSQYFLADPDTYWHITTGKWILVEGRLPRQDIFSHSILGKSWVDLEWLAQVILSVTYDLAGWVGLVLLSGAFVSVTFVLLYKFLARELRATVAMGASAVALVFALPHFLARPHLLTLPIIVVWTALLSRASAGKRRPSLWLLPLMTLWANLHGGFTLGLFLAVGFALEATLAARPHERRRVAVAWLGFCIGALAAGCITPYGYDYILETYHTLALGEVLNHIGEMRPMNPRSEYQQELILAVPSGNGLDLRRKDWTCSSSNYRRASSLCSAACSWSGNSSHRLAVDNCSSIAAAVPFPSSFRGSISFIRHAQSSTPVDSHRSASNACRSWSLRNGVM